MSLLVSQSVKGGKMLIFPSVNYWNDASKTRYLNGHNFFFSSVPIYYVVVKIYFIAWIIGFDLDLIHGNLPIPDNDASVELDKDEKANANQEEAKAVNHYATLNIYKSWNEYYTFRYAYNMITEHTHFTHSQINK